MSAISITIIALGVVIPPRHVLRIWYVAPIEGNPAGDEEAHQRDGGAGTAEKYMNATHEINLITNGLDPKVEVARHTLSLVSLGQQLKALGRKRNWEWRDLNSRLRFHKNELRRLA